MNYIKVFCSTITLLALLAVEPLKAQSIESINKCINFGNALDAPNEGDWGVTIKKEYFEDAANAGFDTVRLPIRWDSHLTDKNNTIDPKFLARVKEILSQASAYGINIIMDVHHYTSLNKSANTKNVQRFYDIWRQISTEFQDYDNSLFFELLNEPHGKVSTQRWNKMLVKAISIIRATNPTRNIIIGGTPYNTSGSLGQLDLSEIDKTNISATFHYYLPLSFTHQGQDWISFDNTSTFSKADKVTATEKFTVVKTWSEKEGIPLILGEFGVSKSAPEDQRIKWINFISQKAEDIDAKWCYWSLADGFGIYDTDNRQFNTNVLNALGM